MATTFKYRTLTEALEAKDLAEFERMLDAQLNGQMARLSDDKRQVFMNKILAGCLAKDSLECGSIAIKKGAKLPEHDNEKEELLLQSRMNIDVLQWLHKENFDLVSPFENGHNIAYTLIEDIFEADIEDIEIIERITRDLQWLLDNEPRFAPYQDIGEKNMLHFVGVLSALYASDPHAPAKAEFLIPVLVKAGVDPKAEDIRFCLPEEYVPSENDRPAQIIAWNAVADLFADYRLNKITVPKNAGQSKVFRDKIDEVNRMLKEEAKMNAAQNRNVAPKIGRVTP